MKGVKMLIRITNGIQKANNFKIIILIICFILTNNLFAQQEDATLVKDSSSTIKEFNQAINMCPGGIIFGIYSVNYEYLLNQTHGLVARFDYESVSETLSDDTIIKANGYGFTFNYRWHFSGAMESFYIGSYVRYKVYNGDANGSTKFDFTLQEYTLGLNVGKRWVWNSGINVNCAFGYGISTLNKETDPTSSANEATLDKFINDYTFIDPFYGEVSIGYTF